MALKLQDSQSRLTRWEEGPGLVLALASRKFPEPPFQPVRPVD
jgi:hypothetical protein